VSFIPSLEAEKYIRYEAKERMRTQKITPGTFFLCLLKVGHTDQPEKLIKIHPLVRPYPQKNKLDTKTHPTQNHPCLPAAKVQK
jgi:hypothetical protein